MFRSSGRSRTPWSEQVRPKHVVVTLIAAVTFGGLLFGVTRPVESTELSVSSPSVDNSVAPKSASDSESENAPATDTTTSTTAAKPETTAHPADQNSDPKPQPKPKMPKSEAAQKDETATKQNPATDAAHATGPNKPDQSNSLDQYYYRAPKLVVSNYQSGATFPYVGFTDTIAGFAYPERFRPVGGASNDFVSGIQFQREPAWIDIWTHRRGTILTDAQRITPDSSAYTYLSIPVAELEVRDDEAGNQITITDRTFNAIAVQQASDVSGLQTTFVFIQHSDHVIELHINDYTNEGAVAFRDLLSGLLLFESVG